VRHEPAVDPLIAPPSWTALIGRIFSRLSHFWFIYTAIGVAGLGVLYGILFTSEANAELVVSIFVVVTMMLIIANNPLTGMLIWLAVTAFVETWINIPMEAGIPDLTFSRFITAFLVIFMLAKAATGEFQFRRMGLTEIGILLTTLGIATAASLSTRPTDVVQTALTLHFTPMVVFFFAKNLVRDEHALNKLFWALTLFGFAAAVYAIYEYSTGNILFLEKGISPDQLLVQYTDSLRLIRGLLGRSSNFARVLAATIPISFYLLFENKTATRKVALVGMLLVQAYGMFLTFNRTSWYTLLVALAILQFLYPRFRRAFVLIVLVAGVTLWATWDQVNESAVFEERVNSKVSTLEGREARWEAGYNMWQAEPIRGWGFGRYQQESGRFRTDGDHRNFLAIENDYLHILIGAGLIGFLPYAVFLLTPLLKSIGLFFRARAPDWSGFIKPETIVIYWCIMLSFLVGSYSQIQTQPIVKMIPFAVAGAVIGTHEHLLRKARSGVKTAAHSVRRARDSGWGIGTRSKERPVLDPGKSRS